MLTGCCTGVFRGVRRGCLALSLFSIGCGGSTTEPQTAADSTINAGAPSTGIVGKLQGTWEIVRYESVDPIDPDAMALMGEMFESMRLVVSDHQLTVDSSKKPLKVDEQADGSFILITEGGMFDKATARFVDENNVLVDDKAETWPGKSTLRRIE